MLKDTKSLGNNKAPACESRGFVLKNEGVLFDTPSFFHIIISKANLLQTHSVKHYLFNLPFYVYEV